MKRGLFSALFLVLVPAASAQFYYSRYISGPVGLLGNFNFADIYSRYAVYIDSIIFLLIFLGLGKLVFGLKEGREREEPGYKLLYVGLALLMTFSLLLFESRMNFTLLDLFGPWVSFVLLIFLTYANYAIASEFIKNKWIVFGLTLASFLFFLDSIYIYFGALNFLGEFVKSLFSSGNHRLLYLLALILILVGFFRYGKKTVGEARELGPTEPVVRRGVEGEEVRPTTATVIKEVVPPEIEKQMGALQEANERLREQLEETRVNYARLVEDLRQARTAEDREREQRDIARLSELEAKGREAEAAKKKVEEEMLRIQKEVQFIFGQKLKEPERIDWEKEKERFGYLEKDLLLPAKIVLEEAEKVIGKGVPPIEIRPGIMRPKAPLLLPPPREVGRMTPEVIESGQTIELPGPKEIAREGEFVTEKELEEALAATGKPAEEKEVEKIKYYTKKINIIGILNEIAKKRDLFEQIERETFLLKLFTKKAMPQRNVLTAKFLDNLQNNLMTLERAASLYLKLYPEGRYAPYINKFRGSHKKEYMNFIEVQKYKAVRKDVRLIVNRITKRYPWVGEIVKKRLSKPTDITIEISNYIANDDKLNQKEKDFLLGQVDVLDKHITAYSKILSDFFNELYKCKVAAEEILKLR